LAVFGLVTSAAAAPVKAKVVNAAPVYLALPAPADQALTAVPVPLTELLQVPQPAPPVAADEPPVTKGPAMPNSAAQTSQPPKTNTPEPAATDVDVPNAVPTEPPAAEEPTGQAYQKVVEPLAASEVVAPEADPATPETPAAAELPLGIATESDWSALVEGATPALVGAYLQLAAAQSALPAAEEAVEAAIAAHADAQRRHAQLTDSLATARRQLAELAQVAADADQALDQSSQALGAMAREAMTKRGMYDPGFAVVLGKDTVDRAIGEHQAREAIGTARRTAISQAQLTIGLTRGAMTRLAAVEAEVLALQAEAKVALDEAAVAKEQAEQAKDQLDALVAELDALTQKMEAEKRADQARQRQLEEEMQQLQAELAEYYQASDGPGPAWVDGFFGAPLITMNLTSPFGPRIHPIYGDERMHAGVDFGAACGQPVFAIAAGVVVQAKSTDGYGNRVVVNHGPVGGAILMSTYNHLESLMLQVGDPVAMGTVVGTVGTTGTSTGCHLHFEIQRDGSVVDPMPLLIFRP